MWKKIKIAKHKVILYSAAMAVPSIRKRIELKLCL